MHVDVRQNREAGYGIVISTPDGEKIGRWMKTYVRVVAVQGTMQVAIIVVMARFATGF